MTDLDTIRDRIDIVALVQETVLLQRSGRTLKGRCPFHQERTPSFIVSPERRTWHCFGSCATGGDVFSFVMRRDNVEFGEAVRLLAARAGVEVSGQTARKDPMLARLYAANEAAAGYFHTLLLNASEAAAARSYAERRGLSSDIIRVFEIGYAPDSWDIIAGGALGPQIKQDDLIEAGLLVRGERGLHDRFRARLIFPIRDNDGKAVGFGGRTLGDGTPKYLNSPQSRVFDKGGLLYALNRATTPIRQTGQAVIVEGYLDAITAHQYGYANVVATLGTALGERHITLLKRYTRSVALALDSDAAGLDAMLRGEKLIREMRDDERAEVVVDWRNLVRVQSRAPLDVRIFSVPGGKDPDEAIRAQPEAWPNWVAGAAPPFEFRLRAELAQLDRANPRARLEFVDRMLPVLAEIADRALQAQYLSQLATSVGLREDDLRQRLNGGSSADRRTTALTSLERAESPRPTSTSSSLRSERFCLALLLRFDRLRPAGEAIDPELFDSSAHRQLFQLWREGRAADADEIPETLQTEFRALHELRMVPAVATDPDAALKDCISRMQLRRVEDQKRLLTAALADETAPPGADGDLEQASAGPATNLESIVLEDIDVGRRLHQIEQQLRTGKPPRPPSPVPDAESAGRRVSDAETTV